MLYRNAVVWDSERKEAEYCDVVTEGAVIKSVSKAGTAEQCSDAAYECGGRVALLPGFVNAHGHASMTLTRGLGEDLPLMDWLSKRIWPVEAHLTSKCIYDGARQSMLEMLSTGTTCFADMYFFMDKVADATLDMGMRAGLSRAMMVDNLKPIEKKLEEAIDLFKNYNGKNGLVNVQLGPHAPYTVPFDFMKTVASAAKSLGAGIQLHWLETEAEWDIAHNPEKLLPEEYLEACGLTEAKTLLLDHCVWMKKEAMPFYAKENIYVAHNPKSNLKLGSGVAPVPEMLEAGIKVAVGTDGASSNNRLDMWEEIKFAALAQKGTKRDTTLMKAEDVLRMATVEGARSLGFDNVGLIKPGYAADFVMVDLDKPNYVGWNVENLAGYIVYAGSAADVKSTVVAGEILYHNGEFTKCDAHEIISEAVKSREFLLDKANKK